MEQGKRQAFMWVAGVWLMAGSAMASIRDADTSLEFRFAGDLARGWRMIRPAAERHAPAAEPWRRATSPAGTREAWMSDRVVLGVREGTAFPEEAVRQRGLRLVTTVHEGLWILQASDVWRAVAAADALARLPDVTVSVPVMRRKLALHGHFAPRPNDPHFTDQWHLQNRDPAGQRLGPDINPRGAWSITRGAGVTVAICDDGFEVDHPDLQAAAAMAPHYDFASNVSTSRVYGPHATCVAGLVAATADNRLGGTGVAPAARIASWAIFDRFGDIVSDERLMQMFQYRIQDVHVQNHSWGNGDVSLNAPSAIEAAAISNAIENGRGGRGVIIVRSSGNGRDFSTDLNDDGYGNDPRVISVGAVGSDGRVASYSNPGACLLVAAPSGDDDDDFNPTPNLFTTDRVGSFGYNPASSSGGSADYAFDDNGFSGTSASAPQISGIVALMLAANPDLGYRDVQQVLLNASVHVDLADPWLQTNGAGLLVSHNQGFGIPDAGYAVELARTWSNRPPLVVTSVVSDEVLNVPDDGLRLWVRANGGPERSARCRSALGPHPDVATPVVPLVYVGLATEELTVDLRGRAALIERGDNFFRDKIAFAAQAGAAFAVIFNNVGGDELIIPAGTDFVPIPAVLITENEGRALVAELETGATIQAQLRVDAVRHVFNVPMTLSCEHVGLRVRAEHAARGDLRITLVSPSGTRSVLQRFNQDIEPAADEWTFWSVQHFYEPSAGQWTAFFSDQEIDVTGRILSSELIFRGVQIQDSDKDGLDDRWEMQWFNTVNYGPADDPDRDGRPNSVEQVMGTDPTRSTTPLRVDLAVYDTNLLRLGWAATSTLDYQVLVADSPGGAPSDVIAVPGRFPEADLVVPVEQGVNRFFRIEEVARAASEQGAGSP